MKISVVIPAYNEGKTIGEIIKKITSLYPDFEVLVIDDGSSDDTAATAEKAGARVFSHPYNIGNGAAIKSGIRRATGDVLFFLDGDGQHDPADIEKFLQFFPEYDMVVGFRSNDSQASSVRAVGNKIYNWLASYVAHFKVLDLTSGFRGIKTDAAHKFLYLLPNTYSYPTTLTLCILKSGRSLKYVPIEAHSRKAGKSNLNIIKDGVRFLMVILKICTLFSPLRIFLPMSFLMFLTGLSYYLYTFITWGRFTNMSALLFTTSIIIFMIGLVSEQISQMRYDQSEHD